MPASSSARAYARSKGFRSGLEELNAEGLRALGVPASYEEHKLSYIAKPKTYLTDFILWNGVVIETKGYFVSADRTKHVLIKDQHPGLDLRFVFSNPSKRIGKKSTTTYAMWCERKGFQYAARVIPIEWLLEPPRQETVEATKKAFGWTPPAATPRTIKANVNKHLTLTAAWSELGAKDTRDNQRALKEAIAKTLKAKRKDP